jgi:hypothetical protein
VEVKAPPTKNTTYVWSVPDVVKADKIRNVLKITSAPKGTHKIVVTSVTVDFDKKELTEDTSTVEIHVGDVPIPPGPDPGPKPPDPKPFGDPRVLVVWESSGQDNLGWLQNSVAIRSWVKSNTKGYRAWDKDIVLDTDEEQVWHQLWTDVKPQIKTLPSLVLVNGQKAVIYPLPKTEKEVLDQLETWRKSFSARKGGK